MTLATGNKSGGAFTLVEILIVLGLIALVGGLIVLNADAFLRGLGQEPVEETFRKAVREARFQAAYHKQTVSLSYEPEEAKLLVNGASGDSLATFPLEIADPNDVGLRFEQRLPFQGLRSFGDAETARAPTVFFRSDRSSTPFNVVFAVERSAFTQRYDPFSAIVIYDSREN